LLEKINDFLAQRKQNSSLIFDSNDIQSIEKIQTFVEDIKESYPNAKELIRKKIEDIKKNKPDLIIPPRVAEALRLAMLHSPKVRSQISQLSKNALSADKGHENQELTFERQKASFQSLQKILKTYRQQHGVSKKISKLLEDAIDNLNTMTQVGAAIKRETDAIKDPISQQKIRQFLWEYAISKSAMGQSIDAQISKIESIAAHAKNCYEILDKDPIRSKIASLEIEKTLSILEILIRIPLVFGNRYELSKNNYRLLVLGICEGSAFNKQPTLLDLLQSSSPNEDKIRLEISRFILSEIKKSPSIILDKENQWITSSINTYLLNIKEHWKDDPTFQAVDRSVTNIKDRLPEFPLPKTVADALRLAMHGSSEVRTTLETLSELDRSNENFNNRERLYERLQEILKKFLAKNDIGKTESKMLNAAIDNLQHLIMIDQTIQQAAEGKGMWQAQSILGEEYALSAETYQLIAQAALSDPGICTSTQELLEKLKKPSLNQAQLLGELSNLILASATKDESGKSIEEAQEVYRKYASSYLGIRNKQELLFGDKFNKTPENIKSFYNEIRELLGKDFALPPDLKIAILDFLVVPEIFDAFQECLKKVKEQQKKHQDKILSNKPFLITGITSALNIIGASLLQTAAERSLLKRFTDLLGHKTGVELHTQTYTDNMIRAIYTDDVLLKGEGTVLRHIMNIRGVKKQLAFESPEMQNLFSKVPGFAPLGLSGCYPEMYYRTEWTRSEDQKKLTLHFGIAAQKEGEGVLYDEFSETIDLTSFGDLEPSQLKTMIEFIKNYACWEESEKISMEKDILSFQENGTWNKKTLIPPILQTLLSSTNAEERKRLSNALRAVAEKFYFTTNSKLVQALAGLGVPKAKEETAPDNWEEIPLNEL
jgi:hypothetical protein